MLVEALLATLLVAVLVAILLEALVVLLPLFPQGGLPCLSNVSSSPIDPSSPRTNCHLRAEQLRTVSLLNP